MPYIGRGSNFGVRTVFHFLASNGDTSVSGSDADGKALNFADGNFIDVYLNGVRLKSGEDYNTATANTVAGLSALDANDEVNIVVYDTFTVADTVKASTGGTFSGDVTTSGTFNATGDTASGDDASMGFTATEGLILTGQGSTNDVTIKNDADTAVLTVATGTTNVDIVGDVTASTLNADGDTSAGDDASIGFTSAEGLILTGQGSTSDITVKNDADTAVLTVATGTTNVDIVGDVTASTLNADGDTAAGDNAAIGYTASEGLILTGQGSTDDITIKNDADTTVVNVATGGTDVEISAGNILFGTADKGVYLGVTSATASNLLDDYEEGTWTPTLTRSGTTMTSQNLSAEASYRKVGSLVHIQFDISITAIGSGGNESAFLSNLPFTAASSAGRGQIFMGYFGGMAKNVIRLGADINPSSTYGDIYDVSDTATTTVVRTGITSLFANGGRIMGSATYTGS